MKHTHGLGKIPLARDKVIGVLARFGKQLRVLDVEETVQRMKKAEG